eukprot:CAMPEP_0205915512 /NCGR_PEP_ID=MMETSP1325-20131115/7922_1 /ASSEMBLY_ACC=CAM_ASM_000708 /TAXON_ID=236786 /ORGANISM="Florenciella sp., Strain RCC1007" /LENGTH=56 /DNA_ID=CAMNT_0053282701 /DNA_START=1 /DNA_END=168 /DNA_ORIENTATION=-
MPVDATDATDGVVVRRVCAMAGDGTSGCVDQLRVQFEGQPLACSLDEGGSVMALEG